MPICEYICSRCRQQFETIVLSTREKISCPKCASTVVEKQLSVFSSRASGSDGAPSSSGGCGCTPQTCAFRDHYAALHEAGARHVFGLSTQDTPYQREAVERLHLPFPILSDEKLQLAEAFSGLLGAAFVGIRDLRIGCTQLARTGLEFAVQLSFRRVGRAGKHAPCRPLPGCLRNGRARSHWATPAACRHNRLRRVS